MVFENQKKKQKRGFPIEDFGNDVGGCIPKCLYEESKQWQGTSLWFQKEKSKGMDA